MISLNSHLDLINTRFATVCNDDDILTFEGLNKSSELLKKNDFFLQSMGKLLRNKISHTMSKKYYQRFKYKIIK